MKDPKPITLNELLSNNSEKYIIPIYQRNYAWGKIEIEQLLQDIIDRSDDKKSNYYLGTLIVDEKENGNVFEVIDGQQRLTTLTLIKAFLNDTKSEKSSLFYEARLEVEKFLNSIFLYKEENYFEGTDDSVKSLKEGFNIIQNFFNSGYDLKGNEINKDTFKKYFEENTVLIRVNVPTDTDINHYFEIMNTRGVQLEKHQILKAAFINQIKDNKNACILFGKIWDSCSNMDKYIQYAFDSETRKTVFGENLTNLPKVEWTLENNSENISALKLSDILNDVEPAKENKDKDSDSFEGRYSSIIDFPNFLLQVLKLHTGNENVSFDDKKLLDAFGYSKENGLPDSIQFIESLLKYRTLFDRYFIKREINNNGVTNWGIRKPSDNKEDYLVHTFQDIENVKMIMIQSMFHVSFPSNSYKNWLFDSLELFQDDNPEKQGENFFNELTVLAKKYYSKYSNWEYSGVGINNYIFNYLDLHLWLDKENLELSNEAKIKFNNFRFSQRSSVEHIFAQNLNDKIEANSEDDRKKILDSFGNLCLISSSTNSKYSDYNFEAKKQQFKDKKIVESLKQVLIFEKPVWNTKEINEHHSEMLEILQKIISSK